MWETGLSLLQDVEMKHCTYDMKECYNVKTVPVIYNVSSNTGYITGGQNLTVNGFGFETGLIEAKVDGVDCKVTAKSQTKFSCTTAVASAASIKAP